MRRHRPAVAMVIACVCMLVLSGIALADAPATPQATPSLQATPNPQATPGQKLLPPPVPPPPIPGIANASQAIQHLGLSQFPNIYVGGVLQPDGSVVVQLGPGNDTAFTNALHALLASSAINALGPEPAVTIVRVPVGQAGFTAAMNALLAALPQLKTQGFVFATSEPDIPAGTYEVTFSAAPKGMTIVAATAELQETVSPLIRVTSLDAPPVHFASDREHDGPSSYDGSDLIHAMYDPNDPTRLSFCTAGFAIIGTLGTPRGSTAAHCNFGSTVNLTFKNGGYRINGYDPAPLPTPDDSTQRTFGTKSNWQLNSQGVDIELLDQPGDPYAPFVWVGQGTSAPTTRPVGPAYTSRPMNGTPLTFDGAFSREHRWVTVTNSNTTMCVGLDSDGYPNRSVCNLIQTNLYSSPPKGQPDQWPGPAVQGGDSGGPVFCYACYPNGTVEPAGLIEATNGSDAAWATWIGADLNAIGGGAHIDTFP